MELTNYKISQHCKTRYVERIIGSSDVNKVNKFIAENEDKIKTDINKMISYGQLLYIGKQSQKDDKGNVLNVYLKDCWIVLVDIKSGITVTLYKIDLGCGDDFNLQYISKMLEKLDEKRKCLEDAQTEVATVSNVYKEMINDNQAQINEFRSMIKNLESLNEAYQSIIDNNTIKVAQANREVAEVINTLVNKREF